MNSLENIQMAVLEVKALEPQIKINENSLKILAQKEDGQTSSLAIKILSVIGGFLGKATFMGFLALVGFFSGEEVFLILGLIMVVGSVFIIRMVDNILLDTLGVSSYIAGVVLIVAGLAVQSVNENVIIFVVLLIGLTSFLLSRSYVFSLITVLAVPGCIVAFVMINKLFILVPISIGVFALVWFLLMSKEPEILASRFLTKQRYSALRSGFLISILGFQIMLLRYWMLPIFGTALLIPSIIIGSLILYLSYKVLLQMEVESMTKKALVLGLLVVFIYATAYMPAILGSLFILLAGFAYNYKMAMYLGILFLIYFIGQYYYDMDLTLLTKSIMMMVSGIVFLLLYWLLSKVKTTTL